jgi:hypothetical protein
MIVKINEVALDPESLGGENLEDILGAIQQDHLPENHVIGEVIVNGQSYSEDVPHAALEVHRTDIQNLAVVTRSPEEIARHFMQNGPMIIDSLLESLPRITEMFRLGDEAEANEHFLRFLESLHLLVNMISRAVDLLNLGLDRELGQMADQESLNQRLSKLAETLGQLLDIQEQQDWIFLADILEYELAPALEEIKDSLPMLETTEH